MGDGNAGKKDLKFDHRLLSQSLVMFRRCRICARARQSEPTVHLWRLLEVIQLNATCCSKMNKRLKKRRKSVSVGSNDTTVFFSRESLNRKSLYCYTSCVCYCVQPCLTTHACSADSDWKSAV